MFSLIIAVVAISVVTVWVFFDSRRINALEVLFFHSDVIRYYVRNWRTQWRLLVTYTSRLSILALTAVFGIIAILHFDYGNPFSLSIWYRIPLTTLLILFAFVPILILPCSYRFHDIDKARCLAREITPYAEHLSLVSELVDALVPAASEFQGASSPWKAWHPKVFNCNRNIWSYEFYEIIFENQQVPRSLILVRQGNNWLKEGTMFLIWNPPSKGFVVGSLLPIIFGGRNFLISRVFDSRVPANWVILEAIEVVQHLVPK